jgi:hypothetical protein
MFKLTAKQVEANDLLGGQSTHVMLAGGARSGKTWLILRALAIRAIKAKKCRQAVLRFRFNACKTKIAMASWPEMMAACFPQIPAAGMNKEDWFFTFPNGSEIWFGGLDDKQRSEKILGGEYCVHPESMVLYSDLTWRRAAKVTKGDELIAFPESLDGHMRLCRSTVIFNKQLTKKRYRVCTNKGDTIVSEGHKFVAYFDDRRTKNFRSMSWKTVEELQPGDKLRFCAPPWTTDRSRDGGWLAGMFDGEGWCSAGKVAMAQNAGPVLDLARELLTNRGLSITEHKSGKCNHLGMSNLWDAMKALGSLRPIRLLAKATTLWEGRYGFNGHGSPVGNPSRHKIRTEARHVAEILSIDYVDDGEVRAIHTTTLTFISDGFLSHNCGVFLNECSEIPYNGRNMALTRLAQNIKRDSDGQPLPLRMYYDQNPPRKGHWTYRLFRQKVDPETKRPLMDSSQYVDLLMNPEDNRANLPREYLDTILPGMSARYQKRFRFGEYQDDAPGALFNDSDIDKWRVMDGVVPDYQRIVVAVDPSGSGDIDNQDNDAIGIVVAALGIDGNAYVVEDLTVKSGPATWGRIATDAYDRHEADAIVGEANYGGAMVAHVIQTARPRTTYRSVTATRGKVVRAEPISGLVETGKVRFLGFFPELEEELSGFTTSGYTGDGSPNRADAFVWAITELFPGIVSGPRKEQKPSSAPVIYASDSTDFPTSTAWQST